MADAGAIGLCVSPHAAVIIGNSAIGIAVITWYLMFVSCAIAYVPSNDEYARRVQLSLTPVIEAKPAVGGRGAPPGETQQ
jgi:hypothetical protein